MSKGPRYSIMKTVLHAIWRPRSLTRIVLPSWSPKEATVLFLSEGMNVPSGEVMRRRLMSNLDSAARRW